MSEWETRTDIDPKRFYIVSTPTHRRLPFYDRPFPFENYVFGVDYGIGKHGWLNDFKALMNMMEGSNEGMCKPGYSAIHCVICLNARKQRAIYQRQRFNQSISSPADHPWLENPDQYEQMLKGEVRLPHVVFNSFAGNPSCKFCRQAQRERRRYQSRSHQ